MVTRQTQSLGRQLEKFSQSFALSAEDLAMFTNIAGYLDQVEPKLDTINTSIIGSISHGQTDGGNPAKVGFRAESSLASITPVTDGQRTDWLGDLDGSAFVKLNSNFGDIITQRVLATASTEITLGNFAAGGSGVRNYMFHASAYRTDTGTTPGYADILDGSGGTVLWSVFLPPNGGGSGFTMPQPFIKSSANTGLFLKPSAAITSMVFNFAGFRSKV